MSPKPLIKRREFLRVSSASIIACLTGKLMGKPQDTSVVTMVESQRFEVFEILDLGIKPFWVRERNLLQNE